MPCKKAYLAAWRITNREKVKADRLQWHRDNKERSAENRRRWQSENPERISEYMRQWSADNPEKRRANEAARRERIGGDKLPDDIRAGLFLKQSGVCPICGFPLGEVSEIDHKVPLAKGGRNVVDNVQLVHPTCNRRKGVQLMAPQKGGPHADT